MATVDELIVEIKAETKGLRNGLTQVTKKLEKTNATANKSLISFKALAGVFATLGLARLASGTVSTIRTFEDLEATLQANSASAAETAQSMKLIEDFTSTTTFQIEEVTSAFIELKRKGITATKDELKGIGNVAAANNVSIKQVAEGITRAATTSIEQLQMLGFTGKSSGDMITLGYGEGADRVEETFKKTSTNVMKFVQSIGENRFDSAIEDRANTVTGAFSNMQDNVSFFAKAIGEGGLKPALVEFARGTASALAAAKPFARIIGFGLKKAFDLLKAVVRSVRNSMEQLKTVMDSPAFMNFATAMTVVVTALVGYKAILIAVGTAQFAFNLLIKRNPLFMAGTAIAAGISFAGDKLAGLGEKLGIVNETLKETATGVLEGAGIFGVIEEMRTQFESTVATTIATNEAADAIANYKKETQAAQKPIHDMTNDIAEQSSVFTTDFVTGLMEGKSALSSFGNFAKDIVKQIISTFIRLTIVNKILNRVFGGFGGFTALPTADLPLPKAGGGAVQAGRPTLVGERGAEIFVPNSSGRIMNNADSMSAMGGGNGVTVNQSINFSTGVVPTVRAEVMRMMPQISDSTKAAVIEASQRGGRFRKALAGA